MPPQTLVPGQPVAAAPVASTPQGVAQPAPVTAPVPTAIPAAQAPPTAPTPGSVSGVQAPAPGMLQNIANYYHIPGQTQNVVAAGQAQGNVAQSQFEQQKAANDIKIKNEQDSLDASKYNITKAADGSLSIINSVGDKVDVATYANLTGQDPAKVLQQNGAADPASQKFINAYNNLQTYAQAQIAAQNGDVQAQAQVADFIKANPGLQNLELGQITQAFMQQYGNYYGLPQNSNDNQLGGLSNVTPTLTSQNNPVSTSAYENPNYQTVFGANQYQPGNGSSSNILSALQSGG